MTGKLKKIVPPILAPLIVAALSYGALRALEPAPPGADRWLEAFKNAELKAHLLSSTYEVQKHYGIIEDRDMFHHRDYMGVKLFEYEVEGVRVQILDHQKAASRFDLEDQRGDEEASSRGGRTYRYYWRQLPPWEIITYPRRRHRGQPVPEELVEKIMAAFEAGSK